MTCSSLSAAEFRGKVKRFYILENGTALAKIIDSNGQSPEVCGDEFWPFQFDSKTVVGQQWVEMIIAADTDRQITFGYSKNNEERCKIRYVYFRDLQGSEDEIPTYARSCLDIKRAYDKAESGIYEIDVDGPDYGIPPFNAYCDMQRAGGRWTLVQIRNREELQLVEEISDPSQPAYVYGGLVDEKWRALRDLSSRLLVSSSPDKSYTSGYVFRLDVIRDLESEACVPLVDSLSQSVLFNYSHRKGKLCGGNTLHSTIGADANTHFHASKRISNLLVIVGTHKNGEGVSIFDSGLSPNPPGNVKEFWASNLFIFVR
ncbi:fibrinogen-like YCDxxxxGGGW domain-containing protein [Aliikangiella coralliicola]|uniref:Fibrinogen C-terminal domain-containing protein n=1 Tax=Aliikangiella coralliicola TaxID=2592383 RepID=A0A545UBH8_9GAMM|nr:fibrinogen-like YCDxxxxGGGW domain-containing protein [Aliikangiella coralliicola]TQV86826.1 hypothetical protein FLL46_13475 [Aliikangiella coralliicola]